MRPALVALSLTLALTGCPSSPPPPAPPGLPGPAAGGPPLPQGPTAPLPPTTPVPPGSGTITITPGVGGGGVAIQGGPPLHGDPVACAAYQACCAPHQGQLSPAGLACGLAPSASNGDCTASLQSIRAIFSEQGLPLPAGCGP